MRQAESEISQLQIGRTQIKREQYLGTCNIVWGSKGSLTHHSEGYLGLSAAVEGSLFEIWSWSSSPSNDDEGNGPTTSLGRYHAQQLNRGRLAVERWVCTGVIANEKQAKQPTTNRGRTVPALLMRLHGAALVICLHTYKSSLKSSSRAFRPGCAQVPGRSRIYRNM